MFCALHHSKLSDTAKFTVKVGERITDTAARWYLTEPTVLFAFIRSLNKCDEADTARRTGNTIGRESQGISKVLPVSRSHFL